MPESEQEIIIISSGPIGGLTIKVLRKYREGQYEKFLEAVYDRRGWNKNGVHKIELLNRIGMNFPELIEAVREY